MLIPAFFSLSPLSQLVVFTLHPFRPALLGGKHLDPSWAKSLQLYPPSHSHLMFVQRIYMMISQGEELSGILFIFD